MATRRKATLPADSVFSVPGQQHRSTAEAGLYRLAEAAQEAGDLPRALAAYSIYLRRAGDADGDLFPVFNACCLTGDFPRAAAALARILRLNLPTEQLIEIANP